MKRIPNTEYVKALAPQDDPPDWMLNGESVRPGRLFEAVIFSAHQFADPRQGEQFTAADALHGGRVAARLSAPVIELEDADYAWLVKVIETYAPRMWGVNGEIAIRAVNRVSDLEAGVDGKRAKPASETPAIAT